ncbi:MAG: alpha-2-macroglobulin family protein [Candidatus Zixiibacteriota bacterium]
MRRAIFIYFILIILFLACDKSEKDEGISKKEETLISYKTYGILSPDGKILIGFNEKMVPPNKIGENLDDAVFSFKPKVKGRAYWQDERTLVFEPGKKLPMRKQFTGKANLEKILSEKRRKGLKKIDLEFIVTGLNLSSEELDFKLVNKDNPRQVHLDGNLVFNMEISQSDLKEAISFYETDADYEKKKRDFEISVEKGSSPKEFLITSSNIERLDTKRYFRMIISASKLDLDKDIIRDLYIPGISDFVIQEVKANQNREANNISLKFSDLLDKDRNYDGFINIEPHADFDISISGNIMNLRGDFDHGESYSITVRAGMRSLWGISLQKDYTKQLSFKDIEPFIEFMQTGMFLPTTNQQKINFRTANIRRVYLTVKEIYPNNLVYFMQDNNIQAGKRSHERFWNYNRVGKTIIQDTLEIGETRNQWFQNQLDLSKILSKHNKGIFIVELSADREDLMYEFPDDWPNWKYYRFIRENAFVSKPIIVSDIGLTAKKSSDKYYVFATDVIKAEPLSGVEIELISYQNQKIASGKTDMGGIIVFDRPEEDAFIITAEKNGQRSLLEFKERVLGSSLFDVGGIARTHEGLKAYIYSDRGVYRPGDSIFVSAIVRNRAKSFPDNHPATAKIYDARGRFFKEILSKESKEGFYTFKFKTNQNSPTGNWRLGLSIGESRFNKTIKVETIVPYKLKANVSSDKEMVDPDKDRYINAQVESKYLFGTPAAGHDVQMKFKLEPYRVSFDKYEKFVFDNEIQSFKPIESNIMEAELNSEGIYEFNWKIPDIDHAPSGLRVSAEADVFEKGGRKIPAKTKIDYRIYDAFVGFQKPEGWYVRTGKEMNTYVIAVNPDGMPIAGRNLKYRVYQNNFSWWYDYDSQEEAKRHFKTDNLTEKIAEGSIQSSSVPVAIKFTPEKYGKLYVEIQDGSNGHTAGYFINAYDWGQGSSMPRDANMLSISTDKEKYNPGDSAYIFVKTPPEGKLLFSLEKGNQIIYTKWRNLHDGKTVIPLKVTDEMVPNTYAHITVIQPHSQTQNDRPIRMYGIAPIMVEDPSTRLNVQIDAPEKILPESEFEVEIQVEDENKTQFTIAVVDEGILDITRFKTPDPWEYFFRKEALGVITADIYSLIIGANWGNPFKSFTVGGDAMEPYLLESDDKPQIKRFKPVAMFKGPLETDRKGRAKVKFKMPNYMGSVRIMAVAAKEGSYGNAELAVPVKSPLMVQPFMPRVLAPKDEIKIPVSIFATEKNIRNVDVKISAEGPVSIIGEKAKRVSFASPGNKDVYFDLKAKPAIGTVKLKFTAEGFGEKAEQVIDIVVRPSSPPIFRSIDKVVEKDIMTSIDIPKAGIDGTSRASIHISRVQKLSMNHRLKWLLHYPYGCIEQTTSAAFPQLYIREIVEMDKEDMKDIDKHINRTIDRIRRFQTREGGLSYWPNQQDVSIWGTNYAMHFLFEAKNKGYHVPKDLIEKLLKFQKRQSRAASGNYLERTYRVYVLALSGNPDMGAMNLLRQNSLDEMNSTSRWYLAAAYKIAGQEKIGNRIMQKAGTSVEDYQETGGCFGSYYRDKAIILEMMTIAGKTNEAMKIYSEIASKISNDSWLNTQTTGYCLLAMGKFVESLKKSGTYKGSIGLPDGKSIKFSSDKAVWSSELAGVFGQTITIDLESDEPVYASVDWEGVPLQDQVSSEWHNLGLRTGWYNDAGVAIDPTYLKQGTSFWGVISVGNTRKENIENIALVQMLPSGWEIQNIRLHGEFAPEWVSDLKVGREEYMDIRDDRIIWFFDFGKWNKQFDFVFKIDVVTPGSFYLPPTRVEAMYDRDYYANQAGKNVKIYTR